MRHKWSSWSGRGHGGWDGAPTGVASTRSCVICGATEWRDSARPCSDGRPRPERGWVDAWGGSWPGRARPDCAGYDVFATRAEAAWEEAEYRRADLDEEEAEYRQLRADLDD